MWSSKALYCYSIYIKKTQPRIYTAWNKVSPIKSPDILTPMLNKRPVGLYSPLLIQIIQYYNKCLHVDASKTGWTQNKKVIKGIHLLQFAQHIHLLFWAKDHFHLNKRPDSLISR